MAPNQTKRTFFSIRRNFAPDSFGLIMDYSLNEIDDFLVLNSGRPTPKDFLEKFSYKTAGGRRFEDMLANNAGWGIFSNRIAKLLSGSKNSSEIELLALPKKVWKLHP